MLQHSSQGEWEPLIGDSDKSDNDGTLWLILFHRLLSVSNLSAVDWIHPKFWCIVMLPILLFMKRMSCINTCTLTKKLLSYDLKWVLSKFCIGSFFFLFHSFYLLKFQKKDFTFWSCVHKSNNSTLPQNFSCHWAMLSDDLNFIWGSDDGFRFGH